MRKPVMVIDVSEDAFSVMNKFAESRQWNLPAVNNEIYVGFFI